MAGAPQTPEWVRTLKQGGTFPHAESSELCSHAWASPSGSNFFVRGPHYPQTKAKVPGGQPLLQPIAFDVLKSSSKLSNIMEHPKCRVRAALHAASQSANLPVMADGVQDLPFVWAFNMQLPTKENHSLVMYFVSFHSPEKGSLMQRFLDGDDAFRNERLKMISSVPQAPRVVKLVVREGGSTSMIGKNLNCTYRKEKDYMEVDVDLGSSVLSRTAFQICVGVSTFVTIDFAFVIEGRYEHELPERIVGAMRLANLDLSLATSFDCPLQSQEAVSKAKQQALYKGVWKILSRRPHDAEAEHREEPSANDDANDKNILFP